MVYTVNRWTRLLGEPQTLSCRAVTVLSLPVIAMLCALAVSCSKLMRLSGCVQTMWYKQHSRCRRHSAAQLQTPGAMRRRTDSSNGNGSRRMSRGRSMLVEKFHVPGSS